MRQGEKNPEIRKHETDLPLFAEQNFYKFAGERADSPSLLQSTRTAMTSPAIQSCLTAPLSANGESGDCRSLSGTGSPRDVKSGLSSEPFAAVQCETGAVLQSAHGIPAPDVAHARRNDPATSKQAAAKITNLGPVRDAIINALYTFGPQTDEGIAAIFKKWAAYPKCSPSGLRSRRSELVTLGFVEDSGELGKSEMGNPAIIWRLRK